MQFIDIHPKLHIAVSDVSDGSMKSLQPEVTSKAQLNRLSFLKNQNISPSDTTLVRLLYEGEDYCRYQVVDSIHKGEGITSDSTMTADALIVRETNHALMLPLADCVGAVFYDETRHVMMLSHLGRHNLEQNGAAESVNFMQQIAGTNPSDLIVWLSPAAGSDNYPLYSFENKSLHEVTLSQLTAAGVLDNAITVSPIDTTQNEQYYSHSEFLKGNQSDDGRFAVTAMMLE